MTPISPDQEQLLQLAELAPEQLGSALSCRRVPAGLATKSGQ